MSLMLPSEFKAFVHTRVVSAAYPSEQDVLRTAVDSVCWRKLMKGLGNCALDSSLDMATAIAKSFLRISPPQLRASIPRAIDNEPVSEVSKK